jgi:hypothetical protein
MIKVALQKSKIYASIEMNEVDQRQLQSELNNLIIHSDNSDKGAYAYTIQILKELCPDWGEDQ